MKKHYLILLSLLFLCFFNVNAQTKIVNVALPNWGTQIKATSEYSSAHAAFNAIDGSLELGHSWLSKDYASLPQTLTMTLHEPFTLTQINVYQSRWTGNMYHSKDFRVEGSTDGTTYQTIATGTLPNESDAKWTADVNNLTYSSIRVVITSSYSNIKVCGLGEVELMASVPENKEPLYENVSQTIDWKTFRGMFKLSFGLDPVAPFWIKTQSAGTDSPAGTYISGAYEVTISETNPESYASIIRWTIKRTDNQPFKILSNNIECKTSYSGVYKLFNPNIISQQNYRVDLPFGFYDVTSAHNNQPVVWMQQTDGKNTLTYGLLDQNPMTVIEGSTYNAGNGGEAPGIANSYVRAAMNRNNPAPTSTVTSYSEGIYVNANPEVSWFEALEGYSQAVDEARIFVPQPTSSWALNPMWHTWYAHADEINEELIRDDARRAKLLGAKTIQIDAGWNVPKGMAYSFDVEGDYVFSDRFPDPAGMIKEMHDAGQRVILHVSPLLMGIYSKAWTNMSDCMLKVNGSTTSYLDPRLKKVQDYLLMSWENMFKNYDIDGLWYDFMEFPNGADAPAAGKPLIATDVYVGYTLLMQSLYKKAIEMKPEAIVVLRRALANLNSKTFCTHVWPMDAPQDYNMNRRDVVYMKSFGKGVLTHACCTSWAISESDLNVARQMASITLAGVPAISNILSASPLNHDIIIKEWFAFYEANKHDLIEGRMTPLLPTPPSAAIRIEGEKKAFFGFYEAMPGLIELTREIDTVTIVNAFSNRTVGSEEWYLAS